MVQILVRASEAHHSAEVHAELCAIIADEIILRDSARDSGCKEHVTAARASCWRSAYASRHAGHADVRSITRAHVHLAGHTVMMSADDIEADLGRSPPCHVCGHVCHFGFVQLGRDRKRSVVSSTRKAATTVQVLRHVAPTLVCLWHASHLKERDLELNGVESSSGSDSGAGRFLFMRYDDTMLMQMAEAAASLIPSCDKSAKGCATLAFPQEAAASLPAAVDSAINEIREKHRLKQGTGKSK